MLILNREGEYAGERAHWTDSRVERILEGRNGKKGNGQIKEQVHHGLKDSRGFL